MTRRKYWTACKMRTHCPGDFATTAPVSVLSSEFRVLGPEYLDPRPCFPYFHFCLQVASYHNDHRGCICILIDRQWPQIRITINSITNSPSRTI